MSLRDYAEELANSHYSSIERWNLLYEYILANPSEGAHAKVMDILPALMNMDTEEAKEISKIVDQHLEELPEYLPGQAFETLHLLYGKHGDLDSSVDFYMN